MPDRSIINRLPHLKSLEAFAIAGKTLSFSAAADQLHLTTSAVSRRIKTLERELGFDLFERTGNTLRLTAEGRNYLPEVARGFQVLRQATTALRRRRRRRVVRVGVLPTFAATWLAPKLPSFFERYPDIEIELEYEAEGATPNWETLDLFIALESRANHSAAAAPLFDVQVTPVCSPRLLEQTGEISGPNDLAGKVLLHCRHSPDFWGQWLAAVGAPAVVPSGHRYFDNLTLLHQAAIAGLGIAIGWTSLVRPHLDAGELMAPIDIVVPVDRRFNLQAPPGGSVETETQAFRTWLLSNARATLR